MKYVAFKQPDENWNGLDWIYNLTEDKNDKHYDFYLVEANSAKEARERVISEFYKAAMKSLGVEGIIEEAFKGFGVKVELSDEEIAEFFGADADAAVYFFDKYGWGTFDWCGVKFYENFAADDRERFYAFNPDTLKRLYSEGIWFDILVMPITKIL